MSVAQQRGGIVPSDLTIDAGDRIADSGSAPGRQSAPTAATIARAALHLLPRQSDAQPGAIPFPDTDFVPAFSTDRPAAAEVPTVRSSATLYELTKRLFDILLSLVLLVLLAPLLLVIALTVRISSPGPVLYRQARCGRHGQTFTCFKFRSMVADADKLQANITDLNEISGPVFKMRRDPRVTPVGRWLRKLSLDELPQLWNVLRGDMSMVGPRPPLPSEVALYDARQWQRLDVTPGLTCLWQVSGRSDLTFDRWVELDLEYIRRRSFAFDLWLVVLTIPAVITGRGAF